MSIRQAIVTTYSEPLNGQPATITATCASGSITIEAYAAQPDLLHQTAPWRPAEHERAARALMERMGWAADHDVVGGLLDHGSLRGQVFVQIPRSANEPDQHPAPDRR